MTIEPLIHAAATVDESTPLNTLSDILQKSKAAVLLDSHQRVGGVITMNAVASSETFAVDTAGLLDLFAIWRLQHACFRHDSYDLFTLFNMTVSPKMIRLKAVANDQLVGFVAGEINGEESTGWIVTLGAHPRMQGRGIGTALLLAAERAMNSKRVRLTVRRSNARAVALYERCGYKWVNTYRRYYHDGEDGLVMEKIL